MKKLNMQGMTHVFLPLFAIVIVAVVGTYLLVASHADSTCTSGLSVTTVAGECESYIGQVSLPQQSQTISAYACVTELSNTSWRTTALFELSDSYKVAGQYTATITNNGSSPVAGNKSVTTTFNDTASPTANLTIYTDPQGENPLTYSYGDGSSAGTIAKNIHPDQLTTCSATSVPPPNTYQSPYLTISPTASSISLNRANPNYGVLPPGTQFTHGDLYAVGFSIHNQSALQYAMQDFTGGTNSGFLNAAGSLQPGQTTNVIAFINPYNFADGDYTFSGLVTYLVPATPAAPQHWVNGPTIHLNVSLAGPTYESYISVNSLSIQAALSRASVNSSGLIFGPSIAVTNVGNQVGGFEVQYTQPTQGQGFYTSSGGLSPQQTDQLQTYINPNKPDGIYSGSAVLQYLNSSQQWVPGPTINYTIDLTN